MDASNLIKLTKISPRAYKRLPKLSLKYGVTSTRFGNCLMAFNKNTLCFLTFFDELPPLDKLEKTWPKAELTEDNALINMNSAKLFGDSNKKHDIELYLKGTDFQVEVWEALLKIKKGETCSYEGLAQSIGRPKALRAVGTAVGKNPVTYFIPCHRVINKDGKLGNFGCGPQKKLQMLNYEGVKI